MEFGYFTLSDNHYEKDRQTSNEFVRNTLTEAV